jgi:hypothetical protein
VHEKPGIEGNRAGRIVDRDGVRVAAKPVVTFEERDTVAAADQIGSGQTGDPGAHDCHVFHAACPDIVYARHRRASHQLLRLPSWVGKQPVPHTWAIELTAKVAWERSTVASR